MSSFTPLDLSAIHASHGITEPADYVDRGAGPHEALEALAAPGVNHLLVGPSAEGAAHGVPAPIDPVDLVTRP